MNYQEITSHLKSKGYHISHRDVVDRGHFIVTLDVLSHQIELIHFEENKLVDVPLFLLLNANLYQHLAHVLTPHDAEKSIGYLCINTPSSLSLNINRPELVFEDTLKRYQNLLEELLANEQFNAKELIREFQAIWNNKVTKSNEKKIICTSEAGGFESLDILKPTSDVGFNSYYLCLSKNSEISDTFYKILNYKREAVDKNIGKAFILPLESLIPPPKDIDELPTWYLKCLSLLAPNIEVEFKKSASYRAHEFWLIFNAPTTSGKTWFCIHFKLKASKGKKVLPFDQESLNNWCLQGVNVLSFNRELIMPRSGAKTELKEKNVLLIGAGSVGGEVAYKLGNIGIGRLSIIDQDFFSLDNLYRHVLNINVLNAAKANAIACELFQKNPWLDVTPYKDTFLNILEVDDYPFSDFDLIIVAIGNPTQERFFFEKLRERKISVPIINTWVEGYGIGGHAILSIPNSKGCLYCAYMDAPTGKNGLASNLNFLKENQDLTKNHGGCGSAFLPYSGIAASQTAIIAADLAIKFLLGEIEISSKVSWKGSAHEATKENLELSDRYHVFDKNLILQPLYNSHCFICNES